MRDESLFELDAQELINLLTERWDAEWGMRDHCRYLVDNRAPDWIRALRDATGISEQKIHRWAEEARLVPPSERAEDISPQTQVRNARRRQA